jgi:CheY-like chemotaxis protein
MNLVVNAAEAMGDERGTVLVTTGTQLIDASYASTLLSSSEAKPGQYVFLEVHDTGCGMTEETKAKIFDPFFTTKFTGRGLGLAAVLGIVRGHQGALKLYSTVGRGTTFKVFFPASDAPSRKDIRVGHASFQGAGLILVVDDDDGVRRAARMILEIFGFDVIEARDGREALRVFAPRAADVVVVLLDMTMPEMGGEETFRELRRIREDVPVILSSGYNEVEATRRFTSKGLAGFLQKPFTSKELGEKLSAAIASRTAR